MEQVANLARLSLSESEIESMTADLGSILDHIEELSRASVEGAEPMGGVSDHPAPLRSDGSDPDPLNLPPSDFAPEWQESLFVVPRLAAMDADASPDSPASSDE